MKLWAFVDPLPVSRAKIHYSCSRKLFSCHKLATVLQYFAVKWVNQQNIKGIVHLIT